MTKLNGLKSLGTVVRYNHTNEVCVLVDYQWLYTAMVDNDNGETFYSNIGEDSFTVLMEHEILDFYVDKIKNMREMFDVVQSNFELEMLEDKMHSLLTSIGRHGLKKYKNK